jgi:endonuclease/exonuclease/phosphatase family metal-dependent hydrolase
MRLATFNILHGRSLDDGHVSLDRLSACIRGLDPDVLALQEVDIDQPRSSLAGLTSIAAAAMAAQLDTPLGVMTVANTHLSFVPGWNRVQLNRLVRDLRGLPGPRVLMGDLNMSAPTPGRRTGLRPLAIAPTFPLRRPERQLDHILTDHDDLVATEAFTPILPISDHRPLVIDVSLR